MFDLGRDRGSKPNFIDLFAGAGGLSEGFVRAGYQPVAHVESDPSASFTLRTREAYHTLKKADELQVYKDYLAGILTRNEFYSFVFPSKPSCVINSAIGKEELGNIFSQIDGFLAGKKPDLIVGGPPCQAYSLVGRARSELRMVGDERNYLFVFYAKFLKRYRPKFFVFENVVGLLSAQDRNGVRYLDMMLSLFNEVGYTVEWKVLSADCFGVLQKRKRVILVGRRGKRSGFFPKIKVVESDFLVQDAIGDLPPLQAGEGTPFATVLRNEPSQWLANSGILTDTRTVTWHQARPHNERDLKIFSDVVGKWNKNRERLSYDELPQELKTHKNQSSFLDRFKVVASDLHASHTVVAHIAKDGNYYIHPDCLQNRSLTPREAARLQSFPDDYYFESTSGRPSRTAAFKQIGNAVPVLLAQRIAEALKENWK